MKFYLHSDVEVIGQNPEMADMSNPQGYIFGEVWYVVAEDESGYRWAHEKRYVKDIDSADHLLGRINESRKIDLKYWREIEPSYGSDAYISTGQELKMLHQERLAG